MTLSASSLAPVFEHLKDGALGVSVTETAGKLVFERVDPVLGVDEVAELVGFTPSTVRAMSRKGLLHPLKSKGFSGSLRFRKSRLVADLARMEEL